MTEAAGSSCLYRGTVVHHRLAPRVHRFAYRVFALFLDLDEIERLRGRLRLFSIDRFNLASFHHADHGARDGSPLRPWVEARLAEAGVGLKRPSIRLLCMPRLLGYVFNPISVYYCSEGDALRAVVCEVKNTFGEQTAYVLPLDPSRRGERPACAKKMYVSPFIEMDATYEFRFVPPGRRLTLVIRESQAGRPVLVATQTGRRLPLSDRAILGCVLRDLLMTFKVTAAIHLEAARLWLKGVRYVPPGASEA